MTPAQFNRHVPRDEFIAGEGPPDDAHPDLNDDKDGAKDVNVDRGDQEHHANDGDGDRETNQAVAVEAEGGFGPVSQIVARVPRSIT